MSAARRPPPGRILVAEDETPMAQLIADALEARGHAVWVASTGAQARALVHEAQPDLIICDLRLPDANGLILFDDLRQHGGQQGSVPVMVCSGTKRNDDRILALRLGADDFIAKPFDVVELQARVEALLRRAGRSGRSGRSGRAGRVWQRSDVGEVGQSDDGEAAPALLEVERAGPVVVDRRNCRVTVNGAEVALTPTEYRLLGVLVGNRGGVCSRQELAKAVWGTHDGGLDRSLEVHMRRLRAKLRAAPAPAPEVITQRGFGYKLGLPPADSAAGYAA